MAKLDADGMIRVDLEWAIEGKNGTRTGKLYGLHEGEVQLAKHGIRLKARRGDTVTINLI